MPAGRKRYGSTPPTIIAPDTSGIDRVTDFPLPPLIDPDAIDLTSTVHYYTVEGAKVRTFSSQNLENLAESSKEKLDIANQIIDIAIGPEACMAGRVRLARHYSTAQLQDLLFLVKSFDERTADAKVKWTVR